MTVQELIEALEQGCYCKFHITENCSREPCFMCSDYIISYAEIVDIIEEVQGDSTGTD